MVKVEFLARSCFDNTKLQIPGFSIFGRHLVPDAALCQALPLRYFVFESVKRKKKKDSTRRPLENNLHEKLKMLPNKTFTLSGTENRTVQNATE